MIKVKQLAFGKINLKRYFGFNFNGWDLSSVDWWGYWLDHYYIKSVNRDGEITVYLVSEPYGIGVDDMKQLLNIAEKYNLNVTIGGSAKHNSGCCRIMVSKL